METAHGPAYPAHGWTRVDDPSTISNALLLDRCAAGDAAAWEYLIGRYERLVFAIATREGVSPADAADITQITFSTLLERLDSIREPDRLAFWLSTVARREAWKWRRLRQREESTSEVEATATNRELDRSIWIQDAIEALGEPCRTLIRAVFFEPGAASYQEISVRLGRPVGSIGPLRARCLQALKTQLDSTAEAT